MLDCGPHHYTPPTWSLVICRFALVQDQIANHLLPQTLLSSSFLPWPRNCVVMLVYATTIISAISQWHRSGLTFHSHHTYTSMRGVLCCASKVSNIYCLYIWLCVTLKGTVMGTHGGCWSRGLSCPTDVHKCIRYHTREQHIWTRPSVRHYSPWIARRTIAVNIYAGVNDA
jgi:hypothetical protein